VNLFLGIDGGGTRTRAFVVDLSGQCAAWGEAGLSNPNHATAEELRGNLQRAVQGALAKAGADWASCSSAFVGMAGVTTAQGRADLCRTVAECGLGHARLGVDHDIRIALAGGLAGAPGMALIVGTGSSCYGRTADGQTWQTGGWEALISDEGSAFYVGREAIAAAARMADGRIPRSSLQETVFQWLSIEHVADILPRIHNRGLSRSEIAGFAPQVIHLAGQGDPVALEILERGAWLLAEMVAANHRMLPTAPAPSVVITGGLGTAETLYREKIVTAIQSQLPTARIHQPRFAPAIGAAMLAMQQAGHSISPDLCAQLERFHLSAGSGEPSASKL
jgi:glucosamine kinase